MPDVIIPLKTLLERGLVQESRVFGRGRHLLLPSVPGAFLRKLALSERAKMLGSLFFLLVGVGMVLSWSAIFPNQQVPAPLFWLWLYVSLAGVGIYVVGRDIQFSLYLDALKLRVVLDDPEVQRNNWKGGENGVKSHYRFPETHLRVLACARHDDLHRRLIGWWSDSSSFVKAKQTLRRLKMLDENDCYVSWRFTVTGMMGAEEQMNLAWRLEVLWDVLLRYEYVEMRRR